MSPKAEQFLDLFNALDEAEREEVLAGLIQFAPQPMFDSEEELNAELLRRCEELESGRVQAIPIEQVLEDLRREFPDLTIPSFP